MVIRRRLRALLIPLLIYSASAGLVAYFVHHAHSGLRGVEAKQAFMAQILQLEDELDTVRSERKEWEHRIALLKADQIDKDLLEERARILLGMVHRNEVVIMER